VEGGRGKKDGREKGQTRKKRKSELSFAEKVSDKFFNRQARGREAHKDGPVEAQKRSDELWRSEKTTRTSFGGGWRQEKGERNSGGGGSPKKRRGSLLISDQKASRDVFSIVGQKGDKGIDSRGATGGRSRKGG